MKEVKIIAEDPSIDAARNISEAWELAQKNSNEDKKWNEFREKLFVLSPSLCEDWDAKMDANVALNTVTDITNKPLLHQISDLFAKVLNR